MLKVLFTNFHNLIFDRLDILLQEEAGKTKFEIYAVNDINLYWLQLMKFNGF